MPMIPARGVGDRTPQCGKLHVIMVATSIRTNGRNRRNAPYDDVAKLVKAVVQLP